MSETLALPLHSGAGGRLGRRAAYREGSRGQLLGLLLRLFFFIGAIKTTNTPTVMRRHREDIFHTTCTACKDLDRRGDNFSVTLSGASAESKGLEFAEHAPVRFVRIYANPPSGPLDFARGDRTMHDSQCTMIRAGSPSVMLSGGAQAPQSKHPDITGRTPCGSRKASIRTKPVSYGGATRTSPSMTRLSEPLDSVARRTG